MLFNRGHKGKGKQEMRRKKVSKKWKIISPYFYSDFLLYEHGIFCPADVADDRLWRVFLRYEIID